MINSRYLLVALVMATVLPNAAPARPLDSLQNDLRAPLQQVEAIHAAAEETSAAEDPDPDWPTITPDAGEVHVTLDLAPEPSSGWEASPIVETDAVMTGIRWAGAAPEAIELRTRNTEDVWSDWEDLEPTDVGQDNAPLPTATEPVWIGRDVTAIQYRVAGTQGGVEAALIADSPAEASDAETPSEGPTAATTDNGVTVNLRSSWDSSGCRNPSATVGYSDVRVTVVHHTATSNSYSAADVPSIIHAICVYHVGTQGWDDIGYNFLVDKYGSVWEGREGGIDLPIRGAHSAGFNSFSSGFALIGDHAFTQPSYASLQSLGKMIGWKMWLEGRPVTGTTKVTSLGSAKWPPGAVVTLNRVSGHRNVQSTSCPGNAAYDDLAGIRVTAKSAKQSLLKTEVGVAGDFDGDGDLDGAALFEDGRWMVSKGKTASFATATEWADVASPAGFRHHVVGDFNGDGKDDIASLRRNTGKWKVAISTGNGFNVKTWFNFKNDKALKYHVAGDFNGDGKDDIASLRKSTGQWKVAISTGNGFNVKTWYNFKNDKALKYHVAGDFNGDGKDDVASFRKSTGQWKVGKSVGGSFKVTTWHDFNKKGFTQHVTGDFDNDGLGDVASYRSTDGAWKVGLSSGSSFNMSTWANVDPGLNWIHPYVGDFHGSNREDIAHFAATDGEWYILKAKTDDSFGVIEAADAPRTKTWGAAGQLSGNGDDDLALARPTGSWVGHIADGGDFDIWLP